MLCKYEIKQLVQQKPMLTLVTTESQYLYFVTVRNVVSMSYVASRCLTKEISFLKINSRAHI